jgi:hypothetical protein
MYNVTLRRFRVTIAVNKNKYYIFACVCVCVCVCVCERDIMSYKAWFFERKLLNLKYVSILSFTFV